MPNAYPALIYGVMLALGSAQAIKAHPIWIPLILIFSYFFSQRKWGKASVLCLLSIFGFLYTSMFFSPDLPKTNKAIISGYAEILSVRKVSTPFQPLWSMDVLLSRYTTSEGQNGRNLRAKVYLPLKTTPPLANKNFYVQGTISKNKGGIWKLRADNWQEIPNTWSSAELRHKAKETVRNYLHTFYPSTETFSLVATLATGELEDYQISAQFSKVGLQHLLGVSGAQFSLVAMFLMGMLRIILPIRASIWCVLLGVSVYFFFIGDNPAVLRAWISIGLFFVSRLFHLGFSALNALGVGLIFQCAYNPFALGEMAFLLSYSCTAAILLVYPHIERWLFFWLPERKLKDIVSLNFLDQHFAVIAAWLRKACALNISVHLCSLPILLFLVADFPLSSLIYNLFFPFIAMIVLFLLLIGVFFSFIPPLAIVIHACNHSLAAYFLKLTSAPPPFLNPHLHLENFPFSLAVLLPIILLFFCLWKRSPAT